PVQKVMLPFYRDGKDLPPDPLLDKRIIAHDPIQKIMLPYYVTGYDLPPDPLIDRRVIANDPVQLVMKTISTLANKDLAGTTLKVIAHDPFRASMEAYWLLASADAAPDPLVRRITAFDPVQKIQQPYALLAYIDV